ncbi:MAG: hypothetical protein K0R50_4076 [Eubacterium sp.]|jgi:hypothetical protein|nr:hypothetical protein [Eubacterium sp.]
MLIDYQAMHKFNEWAEKNPALGRLIILGFFILFIALIYICQHMDEWKYRKKHGKKKRWF